MSTVKAAALLFATLSAAAAQTQITRVLDVAPVWSGHPVAFDLQTRGNRQFIAFYDAGRHMTMAQRRLDSTKWTFVRLASDLVWDSHNSVTMAFDAEGYLHVAGNMHVVPLVYFRSTRPYDITSLEPVHRMTGLQEAKCTYPRFLNGPNDELIFTYRDGRSGNGDQIYNIYDLRTKTWKRLLDTPLTDGESKRNAYLQGPFRGPDGYFHLVWVWRESPDASTNHDLSYARSKDLLHWETSTGKPLHLPMRLQTAEIVDPIPMQGGTLNGGSRTVFDSAGRLIIAYYKFDAHGNTQIYAARLEAGKWVIRQISDWDYRWEPKGGGSIINDLNFDGFSAEPGGMLQLQYWHRKYGFGAWLLQESDLQVKSGTEYRRGWPESLEKPESSFPGIKVRFLSSGRYLLRWETLEPNRDRPREGPLPGPSMLRLYELGR